MIDRPRMLTNTMYYLAGPLVRNGISLALLPFMTRHLVPSDYGIISLVGAVNSFGALLYLGINSASFRLFHKYKDDPGSLGAMLSSNQLFVIATSFLYMTVLVGAYPFLSHSLFNASLGLAWLIVGSAQFTLSFINTINQSILMNTFKGREWFIAELCAALANAAGLVFFLGGTALTFQAVLLSALIGEGARGIWLLRYVLSYYRRARFSFPLLKEAVAYSWPQTPTTVLSFGSSYFDKIFVSKMRSISETGLLDLSSRFSQILKTLIDAVSGVYSPLTLSCLQDRSKQATDRLVSVTHQVVFLLLLCSLCLILFSEEAIMILTAASFQKVRYIVPLYIYNYVFSIFGAVSYWLIYYHTEKTYLQIPLNLLNVVVNIAANIMLIPRFGVYGAAVAMFLSSLITQGAMMVIGLRLTPLPLHFRRLSVLLLLTFGGTGLLYGLDYAGVSIWFKIFAKISMIFVFVLFGVSFKMFNMAMIGETAGLIKRKMTSLMPEQKVE